MSSAPSVPPALATFRVHIIGPFSVERDGVALSMGRWQRRVARLFKLLVVAPHRRRTRDEIIALLWPDASEEAGRANLRLVLHRLRKALGEAGPVVHYDGENISLGSDLPLGWLDADRFEGVLSGPQRIPVDLSA